MQPLMSPSPELIERVAAKLGARPVAWEPVARGYTAASRWIVRGADGRSVFVKAATNANTTAWLRAELRLYAHTAAPFLPKVFGWDGGEQPFLILEDLSQAYWPPPWSAERIRHVLATLVEVAATPPPADLPDMESLREELTGWVQVARDPGPFLTLGLCSPEWLELALPALLHAEAEADLAGDGLAHLDIRSDNICFADDGCGGERVVLVDWNWACRGNPRLDVAAWLPSLRAEGGPAPETLMDGEPELAALIGGFFAARAGQPAFSGGGSRVRALQLRQLRAALPWVAVALGLPPPERSLAP